MAAIGLAGLARLYTRLELVRGVFALLCFKIEILKYQEYQKHENYILSCTDKKILICEHINLCRLRDQITRSLP
jgi:hypothetical protein